MAEVSLQNVSKVFTRRERVNRPWWRFWEPAWSERKCSVVKNLSLKVQDGEFLVVVGPSGCGKSTTLRLVAGLEQVTEGKVFIGNRLVNDVAPKERDVAMVFQNYALYPHMTVKENMAFGLRMRKVPGAEIDRRVAQVAEMLGLVDLLQRRPAELSGGQRQRVAMGRAIVRQPKVYLMDEPLSNLDAKLRVHMRAELARLHRQLGVTTIYVTHDQTEAMTLGERIVVLKDGVVQQIASPLELYDDPSNRFVAEFIGSPAMNFLTAEFIQDGAVMRAAGAGYRCELPVWMLQGVRPDKGRQLVIGVRPQDGRLQSGSGDKGDEVGLSLQLMVEVVEPLGAETYVYGTNEAGGEFTVKVEAGRRLKAGELLRVSFPVERIYVFDKDTGDTVASPVKTENILRGVS